MASCHTHAATHNRDREARRRKDSREEGGVGMAERKAAWVWQDAIPS